MTENSTMIAVDSLVANEFEVLIEDETMLGVFRIDGLTTFQLDEDGNRLLPTFNLVKMVQRDGRNAFNTWLSESRQNNDRPRRKIDIIAIDDGVETRRWTFANAWITAVRYEMFDSASSQMVEEIVTIAYDSVTETWPAI